MVTHQYEYISGPEHLNHFYQHGSVVSKHIHFVSILDRISYKKDDKCTFYFDNFTKGKRGLNTYIGKINNSNSECDSLLRMFLPLFLDKLGLSHNDIDFSADFTLDDLSEKRVPIINVKGLFVTAYDKATLKIHELNVIDMTSFVKCFLKKDSLQDNFKLFRPTIDKLLRNLQKREKVQSNFKFCEMKIYTDCLRSYFTELISKENNPYPVLNPLFIPQNSNNDTLNEFDSQANSQSVTDTEHFSEKGTSFSNKRDASDDIVGSGSSGRANNQDDSGIESIEDKIYKDGSEEQKRNLTVPSANDIRKPKRIKVTEIGALKRGHQIPHPYPDISSYQLPFGANSFSEARNDQDIVDNYSFSSATIKPNGISEAESKRFYRISDCRIVGFTPNQFLDDRLDSLEDNKFQIFIYAKGLPPPLPVFIPEYNCYEVTVSNISEFFHNIGIKSYPSSIPNCLSDLKKKINHSNYNITLFKATHSLGPSETVGWVLHSITCKSPTISPPIQPSEQQNQFPLVHVSDIIASTNSQYYTIFGLAVTVKYDGGKTVVLSFTDFTSNPKVNYGYDSFLGSFHERIPENQHVHALIYLNRVESLNQKLQNVTKMGLIDCADKGNSNITHRSIIFKFSVKCQLFQGKLNTVILDAEPITPKTPLTTEEYRYLKPLRTKVFRRMPSEVLKLYNLTMARFLPISKYKSNNEEPELHEEQVFVNTNTNAADKVDYTALIQGETNSDDTEELREKDAMLPIKILGSRNPSSVKITDIKNNRNIDSQDKKINATIMGVTQDRKNVTIYLTDRDYATGMVIEDPYKNLLKIQIWGKQNLEFFFGDSNYMQRIEELRQCIGSTIPFTVIPRILKINDYFYIKIWSPIYTTLESLLIFKSIDFQHDTLKYENSSGNED
ncbi:hypothetical protein C6P43_001007 [Kluyveromyces marxianus]|nr:hypothetical protein C6P43_001007 [Kluyveromyces marxianus]